MVFLTPCGMFRVSQSMITNLVPPMNPTAAQTENSAAVVPAATEASPSPASRLARFFDTFFRYAGAIAVDHTHMLPLDRVSGRTGIVPPRAPQRCCC